MSLLLPPACARRLATFAMLATLAACSDGVPPTAPPAAPVGAPRSVFSSSIAASVSSYTFVVGAYTWQQAMENAQAAGGHLAIITSVEEQAEIVALANSVGLAPGQYWIGGSRSSGGSAVCGWSWVDGSPIPVDRAGACFNSGYSNWHAINPSGDGQAMSLLWYPSDVSQRGQWNDAPGSLAFGYLMEVTASVQITAPDSASEGDRIPIVVTTTNATSVAWNLGDGTVGTGAVPATHVYADNGSYVITVTLNGATSPTASHTITVANAAPTIYSFAGATAGEKRLLVGETYRSDGLFFDPGAADTHTATVSYADDLPAQDLALSRSGINGAFLLEYTYTTYRAKVAVVTVSVKDDDGAVVKKSAAVMVLSPREGLDYLSQRLKALNDAGTFRRSDFQILESHLSAALRTMGREPSAALKNLSHFEQRIRLMAIAGVITQSVADPLYNYSVRIRKSFCLTSGLSSSSSCP